jgi:hypothetical protein
MASTVGWLVLGRVLVVAGVTAVVLGSLAVSFGLDGRPVPSLVSGTAAAGAVAAGWWYLRRTLATVE